MTLGRDIHHVSAMAENVSSGTLNPAQTTNQPWLKRHSQAQLKLDE